MLADALNWEALDWEALGWATLAVASAATLTLRHPWTALLAQGRYTAEVRAHPLFREANLLITGAWTLYFAVAAVTTALTSPWAAVAWAAPAPLLGWASFRVGDRYAVFDLPVTLSAASIRAGSPFPYRWNPAHRARIGLLPLYGDGSAIGWFDVDPCYVFHTLNAYDDGEQVVIDLVRHDRTFAVQVNGPADAQPVLERWTVDPGGGTVKRETLDDRPQEFPRHDERRTGLPHRYGYATAFTDQPDGEVAILKHDLLRSSVQSRPIGPGSGPAEPVYVSRTAGAAEDDGWLLCLSYDRDRDGTDLLILSAADITAEPEAVVHLPVRVPAGFHGNWIEDTPGGG